MKIRIISLLILIVFISSVIAQDSVKLKLNFRPDKIYSFTSDMVNEINPGNKDASSGDQNAFPLNNTIIKQHLEEEVKCGSLKEDNTFGIVMTITKFDMKSILNGIETSNASPFSLQGLQIEGICKPDNTIENVVIKGNNFPEQMKSIFTTMLSEMMNKIKFPDKAIKVGDSFTQETPLALPIPNAGKMNMKIVNNYLLEKIENGEPVFKVKSKVELSNTENKSISSAIGEGEGVLIYNLTYQFYRVYDSEINMTMDIPAADSKMIMKSKSKMTCKVE